MPRGKNTNVHMYCVPCREAGTAITIYTTRINKQKAASMGKPTKLEIMKFCPVCMKHQMHESKDIKKAGTKALANSK